MVVKRLFWCGLCKRYQIKGNSEYRKYAELASETLGDKLRRQKGNSPDLQIKAPKYLLSVKGSGVAVTTGRFA